MRLALAGAAVWAVARELRGVDVSALSLEIASLRPSQYLLGVTCTVASFFLLGVIEWMALRNGDGSAARRVPLSAALRTGFVANALSQSVGLAVLTGAAMRARAYARHGLDAIDMAQATAFVTITSTLGLLAAGAVAVYANGGAVALGAVSFVARTTALVLGSLVAGSCRAACGRGHGAGDVPGGVLPRSALRCGCAGGGDRVVATPRVSFAHDDPSEWLSSGLAVRAGTENGARWMGGAPRRDRAESARVRLPRTRCAPARGSRTLRCRHGRRCASARNVGRQVCRASRRRSCG
jgi:hypothetical protein